MNNYGVLFVLKKGRWVYGMLRGLILRGGQVVQKVSGVNKVGTKGN